MTIAGLVQEAAKIIGDDIEATDDCYTVEVELDDERSQVVTVWTGTCEAISYLDDDEEIVYVDGDVGPLPPLLEPRILLAQAEGMSLSRVYVDDEGDVSVQAGIPLRAVTPEVLAAMIDEVATEVDMLEEEIFGADEE